MASFLSVRECAITGFRILVALDIQGPPFILSDFCGNCLRSVTFAMVLSSEENRTALAGTSGGPDSEALPVKLRSYACMYSMDGSGDCSDLAVLPSASVQRPGPHTIIQLLAPWSSPCHTKLLRRRRVPWPLSSITVLQVRFVQKDS